MAIAAVAIIAMALKFLLSDQLAEETKGSTPAPSVSAAQGAAANPTTVEASHAPSESAALSARNAERPPKLSSQKNPWAAGDKPDAVPPEMLETFSKVYGALGDEAQQIMRKEEAIVKAHPDADGGVKAKIHLLLSPSLLVNFPTYLTDPNTRPLFEQMLKNSRIFVSIRDELSKAALWEGVKAPFAAARTPEELLAVAKTAAQEYQPKYEAKLAALNFAPDELEVITRFRRIGQAFGWIWQYTDAQGLRFDTKSYTFQKKN